MGQAAVPTLHTVEEAISILRIGRTTFYKLHNEGRFKITKLGSRSFVEQSDLMLLIESRQPASKSLKLARPKAQCTTFKVRGGL